MAGFEVTTEVTWALLETLRGSRFVWAFAEFAIGAHSAAVTIERACPRRAQLRR